MCESSRGRERVLTELLDKMSVFEGGESSGPRRKGLEGQSSPRVGSAGPGVPAASADSCSLGWRGQGCLSHFQENTELSTRAPAESLFQASSDVEKNSYEMLKLESSRTLQDVS